MYNILYLIQILWKSNSIHVYHKLKVWVLIVDNSIGDRFYKMNKLDDTMIQKNFKISCKKEKNE